MKRFFVGMGFALSLFAVGAFAESWSGVISDASCGAKHKAATEADQKCAATCIKDGEAVLLVGDKVFKIENKAAIKGHEGHKVTVSGSIKGDSIHVDTVKM